MSVAFAQIVLRALDAEIDARGALIAQGGLPDWPTYRGQVGERNGLLRARSIVTDQFDTETRESFQLNERNT